MKIDLNEIVDPFGARVVVRVDAEGHPEDAWFDLVGLPRVDALLVGQPVTHAPTVVERLCGICPAAHHLAGVRALEALAGQGPVPATADAVRRLLHLGSALETHAVRFVGVDREAAVTVRRAGRAAMAASGSPGHFPATAVPGGVRAAVDPGVLAGLRGQVADAVAAARAVADALASHPGIGDDFAGADVALVDAEGRPDLLGEWVRAVAPDGRVLVEAGAPQEWPRLVAEERPGAVAPRPYLTALGPGAGWYRVGPVAQLRIGVPRTPQAADLRERWLAGGGGATAARAIVTLAAAEALAVVLERPELTSGAVEGPGAGAGTGGLSGGGDRGVGTHPGPQGDAPTLTGTGWVDGPRGLLVHTYAADGDGVLTASRILTPTAQNEPWLGSLLAAAASGPDAERAGRLEDSIREADPCLPVASAPPGGMGLRVDVIGGTEVR